MKKFMFCLISLVVLIFVGFSTYYVLRNNESIAYTVGDKETVYMNKGETISSPVIHENKAKGSKVSISLSNDNVIFNEQKNTFEAVKTGSTTITCVPSNTKFNSINFTITVGDGSTTYPYYIRNEEDLNKIGVGEWKLSCNYELVADITLTKPFSPIGSERSPFIGTFFGGEVLHTINNIQIANTSQVAGVFASLGSSARIERINFSNVQIDGKFSYAGLVAGINNGFIGQCLVSGQINNGFAAGFTGGIVGKNESLGGYAQISLCTVDANIKANNFVGGVAGQSLGGVVDNCLISVDTSMQSNSIFGGIAGQNTYSSIMVDGKIKYINAKFVNILTFLNKIGPYGDYYTMIGQTNAKAFEPSSLSYFDSLFTCSSNALSPIGKNTDDNTLSSNASTSVGYYKNLSTTELNNQSVFTSKSGSSWNFDEFWSIIDGGNLFIDYELCAGSYQTLPDGASIKSELTTSAAVKDALALMRRYPNANLEYKVTKNLSVDLGNQTFAPIGNEQIPFMGKLIVDEDKVLMLRNFTVVNNSGAAGLFGKIQGSETILQGLTLSNCTIIGKTVGGIAGINEGATIEKCSVDGFTLKTSGVAGALVGVNNGQIANSYANQTGGYSVIELSNVIDEEAIIGAAVGSNLGSINSIESLMINVNIYSETSKTVYVGGIAGKLIGTISNCACYNLNADAEKLSGDAFVGGIAGSIDSGSVIQSFVSNASITSSELGQNSYIGGISGAVHESGSIENCIFESGTIVAKKAGGIAGQLYGKIEQCAVSSTTIIEGYYVGGIVCDCNGQIRNSYSLASLKGSAVEAGFVTYLNDGGSVKYCYNYCAYTGDGKGYCESATSFRSKKGNREFLNNVVVGENVGGGGLLGDTFVNQARQRDKNKKVNIQTRLGYSKGTYYIVSEDVALGLTAFSEFVSHGFDSNIWNINMQSGEEQNYLSLNNLPEIPSGDEEEDDEGEEIE